MSILNRRPTPFVLAVLFALAVGLLAQLLDQNQTLANAQGDRKQPAPQIGVCDLVGLANDALLAPADTTEREAAEKDFAASIDAIEREVKRLRQATLAAQGQAPESLHINLNARRIDLNYQESAVKQQRERLAKRQFAAAYAKVRQAAKAVSKERGITLLLQSSNDDAPLVPEADNAWFVSDVLGRVAVVADDIPDLTEAVRKRLGITTQHAGQPPADAESKPETNSK